MSKIKEVLRLKLLNQLSNRQIQTITGVSRNSVANYVNSFNPDYAIGKFQSKQTYYKI